MSNIRFGTPRLETLDDVIRYLRRMSGDLDRLAGSVPALTASNPVTGFVDNTVIRAAGAGGSIQDSLAYVADDGTISVGVAPPDGVPLLTLVLDSAAAGQGIYIQQNSTGDAQLRFGLVLGNDSFALGMDNSDDNKFKICDNANLSSGARIIVDLDGYISLNLPTSEPADAAIDQNMTSFWYDSSVPSIEAKHRDGADAIRVGTVAPLGGVYSESQTIATGAVTVDTLSGSQFRVLEVDTEGGASEDDLDTISGTKANDLLLLLSADSDRDVRLTDAGNLNLSTFGAFKLLSTSDRVLLHSDGSSLYAVSMQNN